MANLDHQKYHKHIFPDLSLTLKRFYVGDTPDDLGTVPFWKSVIAGMYSQMPKPSLWSGVEIEIWDTKSPDLINFKNSKIQHLLDYDPQLPGDQGAAELYFMGNSKKIALACPLPNPWDTIDPVGWCAKNLSHGFGHLYHDICGFSDAESNGGVYDHLTSLFEQYRPRQAQNIHEDFAEVYRASFGHRGTLGYFSDNQPFTASPELYTLLENAYDLSSLLEGVDVSDMALHSSGWVTWTQWTWKWWWKDRTYKAMKHGDVFTYTNEGWKSGE